MAAARGDVAHEVGQHPLDRVRGDQPHLQRHGVGGLAARCIDAGLCVQKAAIERRADPLGQLAVALGVLAGVEDRGDPRQRAHVPVIDRGRGERRGRMPGRRRGAAVRLRLHVVAQPPLDHVVLRQAAQVGDQPPQPVVVAGQQRFVVQEPVERPYHHRVAARPVGRGVGVGVVRAAPVDGADRGDVAVLLLRVGDVVRPLGPEGGAVEVVQVVLRDRIA